MPYLGELIVGNQVCVTLRLNKGASDNAHLMVAAATLNGTPMGGDARIVIPGGNETICLTLTQPGILDIMVDCAAKTDGGALDVTENGLPKYAAKVKGDNDWSCAVIE